MQVNRKPPRQGILTEKHVFYLYVTGILMTILFISLMKSSDKQLQKVTLDAVLQSKNERIEQLQKQLMENKIAIEKQTVAENLLRCKIDSLQNMKAEVKVVFKHKLEKLPTFAAQDVVQYFQNRLSE